MNPDLWIPLGGMITGVFSVTAISWAMVRIFQGPVGQALARRLQGKSGDADLLNEVLELRHQLEQTQQRLTETEDRIDFNERLLAQRAESPAERPS